MNNNRTILITGAYGFIGSNLVQYMYENTEYNLLLLDSFTYAADVNNISKDIVNNNDRVSTIEIDIRDKKNVDWMFERMDIHDVIHLAAESHVDNSISNPTIFVETNVLGTVNLLNAAKHAWKDDLSAHRFHLVSTDEVYGSLGKTDPAFTEENHYDPHSPYSASKAAQDHFVRAYRDTYGMNITITNCSNNYGPNQHVEKLIPHFIYNIINNIELPVYGDGSNVRDWLYVIDHARAITLVLEKGKSGETYNVGGNCELSNNVITDYLVEMVDKRLGRPEGTSRSLIRYVEDRAGHDFRYAMDTTKIRKELGWTPNETFKSGLEKTIDHYLSKFMNN